jgi:tetratricopeptide (TPR) repeat protein
VTDDRRDDRPERATPGWAAVPTMPWSRVTPSGEETDEQDELAERERRARARRAERDGAETDWFGDTGRVPAPPQSAGAPTAYASPAAPTYPGQAPAYPGSTPPAYPTPAPAYPSSPPPAQPHLWPRQTEPTSPAPVDDPFGLSAVRPDWATASTGENVIAQVSGAPVSQISPAGPRPHEAGPNPEQLLAEVKLDLDPVTLYETTSEPESLSAIRDLLTSRLNVATDNASRARLLGLRSVVARVLGDLRSAQADGRMALAHAEATGQLRRIAVAQARLANVLVRLDEHAEADELLAKANSNEVPERLRATIHHYAGKCAFAQDRYIEACQHFERALELRRDGDPELVAATEVALDALFSRVAERGWGPYPRGRDEILRTHKAPAPAFDENADRWGYQEADGRWPIPPQFADVQPFREGVAWVRPVGVETWGLIDEAGRALIHPSTGYLGVGSFSDGLAWVSRDGLGRWIAIDKSNRTVIQGGFDDVRPFRRGIAVVRQRGRWGAVENSGRLVVQFAFDAFATGLADGRYVDGFTDEGLAVVELGGRKGVIDRTGRVVVQLAYPVVVIHPVAFLYVDAHHRWGALDRNGVALVDPVHSSRAAVINELESLMADTRPML